MNKFNSLLLILSLLFCGAVNAKDVGEVKYSRGAVTAQKEDGSGARLIGRGGKFLEGEVLKTGSRSFAIINLTDNTRMTLRPNTTFAVEQMSAKDDSTASALLRLFKGGIRAVTGFISKQNPRGYRLRTNVATIGIRGTEFDARICGDDCAEENKQHEKAQKKAQEKIVGRVVYVLGTLNAVNFKDKARVLKASSNLYEGDTLNTEKNSYAVIVFKDKSRISLQANSTFRIDKLHYNKKEPKKASAFFSLLKGGLRALSGIIGKANRDNYRMRTHVATIGIRGTGYDLLCTGACVAENAGVVDASAQGLPQGDGLYVNVWAGSVTVGDKIINTGKAAFIKNLATPPVILPNIPKVFKENKVPQPDKIKMEDVDFSAPAEQDAPPGLYVSVTDGEVTLQSDNSDQQQVIKKGQAAFTDVKGAQVKALPTIPTFQKLDVVPTPKNFKPSAISLGSGNLGKDDEVSCEIK